LKDQATLPKILAYDSEGRLCAVLQPSYMGGGQFRYIYDASGLRVAKGRVAHPNQYESARPSSARVGGEQSSPA